MAIKCPHCGSENGDRNLRCSLCGKFLPQGSVDAAAQPPEQAPPVRSGYPDEPVRPRRESRESYEFIYDTAAGPAQGQDEHLAPPPGARSFSERRTYRDEQPSSRGLKLGVAFSFNRRLLPSVILLIIIGALFIAATYMPWLKFVSLNNKEYTGWELYELGKTGFNGGSALHIPDVLNISSGDYKSNSGMILTGLWTLAGGILLLVLAVLLPLVSRSYLCIVTAVLGLGLLVVTGINLATVLIGGGSLLWPVCVLPAAGLVVLIIGYDSRRAL